ncbi:hypothetical protein EGH22_19100 [Halomicroarcula sp. F28]|uniref:hypothetical protein n=1 Tax=Haloarcula salinisoli TaxID=2487746 RepID=UPI001C737FE2|nr:hypothetical protein [Halomicroarcula salinisoli]MBX0288443.1 hypothetical protein [Halomicroarcula salinisoli]
MNTTESPTPTSDRNTPAATVAAQPAGTEPLDFQAVREEHPTTWEAALDVNATVTEGGRPDLFLVNAIDEVPQNCSLAQTQDGKFSGWCSCQTFDAVSVCPHLCTLRQRASLDMLAIPLRER